MATNPDMTRLELIDMDSPDVIEWTGSVQDFDLAQLSEAEVIHLMDRHYVVIGGGASPVYCVRFAREVAQ